MSPLHSQTSVPQHGPQRWWVRKGSHDTRQNQFKTQHCGPGPGTIVQRAHWSRIPGSSFAVPRRGPVNATEPRRRCHGRVPKAPTRWPSLSMPAERGWRKHWFMRCWYSYVMCQISCSNVAQWRHGVYAIAMNSGLWVLLAIRRI